MSQTWDIAYFATLVVGAGVGDSLSEGVGAVAAVTPVAGSGNTDSTGVGTAGAPQVWAFNYVSVIAAVTGAGNTDSTGVGSAGTPQVWEFNYWDGVVVYTGSGNTDSTGVGAATALGAATWYTITGTAIPLAVAAGAGNTDSTGVGVVGTYDPIPTVTGIGDTLSQGSDSGIGTVLPPGAILLSPYWEPGELVYVYTLWEWLGSYEARLNAGHGPLTTTATAAADSTVAIGGLNPGQYVAADGRHKVHFMVTE